VPATKVETRSDLTADQISAVLHLIAQVTDRYGVRPVSEHVMLHVRFGGDANTRHVLLRSGTELVGYAHLDLSAAEAELAAVDPADIRALVDASSAEAGDSLRVWARGRASASKAVLDELGFRPDRVLLQMRRSLRDPPLDQPAWPPGVTVRTFVVGQDEAGWVEVNNLAFAHHPDQSGWSVSDLVTREHEPWFDPAGFFLAERDGALVGFHWTKVHDAEGADHEPIGEVYVVGVAPTMQGQRLGPALTLAGLLYLQGLGLATVMLYVDESNDAAVRVYERLGFTEWDADICFQRPAGA
jgi:mycothiol synthase